MFDSDSSRSHRDSPLYKKALEIVELAEALVEALPEHAPNAAYSEEHPKYDADGNEVELGMGFHGEMAQDAWEEFKKNIMECASIIPYKISNAEGCGIYDLRMENAALVRKAARELVTNMQGLRMCGYDEPQYLNLVRTAVEKEFKPLFREWVSTFVDGDFIPDSWGLFNPPGVNWDDE